MLQNIFPIGLDFNISNQEIQQPKGSQQLIVKNP